MSCPGAMTLSRWPAAHLSVRNLAHSHDALASLPLPLAHKILCLLAVDARLRCVEVSRSWRAVLVDPAFWLDLDVSQTSGLNHFSEALLRAAASKAGGRCCAMSRRGSRCGCSLSLCSTRTCRILSRGACCGVGKQMLLRFAATWLATARSRSWRLTTRLSFLRLRFGRWWTSP